MYICQSPRDSNRSKWKWSWKGPLFQVSSLISAIERFPFRACGSDLSRIACLGLRCGSPGFIVQPAEKCSTTSTTVLWSYLLCHFSWSHLKIKIKKKYSPHVPSSSHFPSIPTFVKATQMRTNLKEMALMYIRTLELKHPQIHHRSGAAKTQIHVHEGWLRSASRLPTHDLRVFPTNSGCRSSGDLFFCGVRTKNEPRDQGAYEPTNIWEAKRTATSGRLRNKEYLPWTIDLHNSKSKEMSYRRNPLCRLVIH